MIYLYAGEPNDMYASATIIQSDKILPAGQNQPLFAITHQLNRSGHITIDGADETCADFIVDRYEDDEQFYRERLQVHSNITPGDEVSVELSYGLSKDPECYTSTDFLLRHRQLLMNSVESEWGLYKVDIYARWISFRFCNDDLDDESVRLKTPIASGGEVEITVPANRGGGYIGLTSYCGSHLRFKITTSRSGETLVLCLPTQSDQTESAVIPAFRVVPDGDDVIIQRFYPLDNIKDENALRRLLQHDQGFFVW